MSTLDERLKNFVPMEVEEMLAGLDLSWAKCTEQKCPLSDMTHAAVGTHLVANLVESLPIGLNQAVAYGLIFEGLKIINAYALRDDVPVDKARVVEFVSVIIDRVNERTASLLSPRM